MEELRALCAKYPARLIFTSTRQVSSGSSCPGARTCPPRRIGRRREAPRACSSRIDCLPSYAQMSAALRRLTRPSSGRQRNPAASRTRLHLSRTPRRPMRGQTPRHSTFRKWWCDLILPFVRRFTHEPVLHLVDSCSSHGDLVDDRG